jgi:outer membrane protein assembly factor BamB
MADVRGWLSWRGPHQTGVSDEKGLPDKWELGGVNDLWSIPLAGGGTPVIANGKLFALGYEGAGPDLREVVVSVDAETGKVLWKHYFNDFLSDIVYDRYAIGSPAIDPETGNVYVTTSAGMFACFTPAGKVLWQHSLMEQLGRLTFTNGRTGGPTIDDDLCIIRYITSNWGGDGPASDRIYGFDKKSGALVWTSTPSGRPKDNSFARPYLSYLNGQRVLYTGAGDGSLVCVNARTGQPIWQFPVSAGGMNASVVQYKNTIIGIHADENLDSSDSGRMVAVKVDDKPSAVPEIPTPQLPKTAEAWRNELGAISSSPILVGNRLYQMNKTGMLCNVDADTGKIIWKERLGPDQLHASPTYAEGKLYIPIQNGLFFIVRPTEEKPEVLAKVQLAGRCIGAPAIWNGKVYVFSTEKLYCFGKKGNNPGLPKPTAAEVKPKPGPTVALQVTPSEVLLRPGEKAKFIIHGIDANGYRTQTFTATDAKWEKFIPPTARVRAEMDGAFDSTGELVAGTKPSAGAYKATIGSFSGTIRGRVISKLPATEDFEEFAITETAPAPDGGKFAYPPLPWIGARFKFDIRELDGNKVFAKTLDNVFFQRATVFMGHPDERNYTMEADVRTDGNRRSKSSVGLVNQHYYFILQGNAQELEISSNPEHFKQTVPFEIKAGEWYRLKTRVDIASDGSGVIRAKAWKKGDPEPEKWTIEAPHKHAHDIGAPGLFAFSPQSQFKVYIDNIKVTPNTAQAASGK